MRIIYATEQIIERLRSTTTQITPEEHQLLGITPEIVQTFADPNQVADPGPSVEEVVTSAYEDVPAFKKMVTEDPARAVKVVQKFLKHLKTIIPPSMATWISSDTYRQAEQMIRAGLSEKVLLLSDAELGMFGLSRAQLRSGISSSVLKNAVHYFLGQQVDRSGHHVLNKATQSMPVHLKEQYLYRFLKEVHEQRLSRGEIPEVEQELLGKDLRDLKQIVHGLVTPKEYGVLQPLSDADLNMFDLGRSDISPDIQFNSIRDNISWFLGFSEKAGPSGEVIKNEATRKMPSDLKKDYVFRLLREIRDLKIARHGEIKDFEQRWLGKDLHDLERIVEDMVSRKFKREPVEKTDSWQHVSQRMTEILLYLNKFLNMFKRPGLRDSLTKIGDLLDSSLPPVDLINDRLQGIQDEARSLGLSKKQFSMLAHIDPITFEHEPMISKEHIDKIKSDLNILNSKIETTQQSAHKVDPVLLENKKNLERYIESIEELSRKNTVGLFNAIKEYMETLNSYRSYVEKNLVKEKSDPDFEELLKLSADISVLFDRQTSQMQLRTRWEGTPSRFEKGPAEETKKTAAGVDDSMYAQMLQEYRGSGIHESLNKVMDIVDDTSEGLSFLRDKILSILGAGPKPEKNEQGEIVTPGNALNYSDRDFSKDPLKGVGPTIGEIDKKLKKIREFFSKLDIAKKKGQASEILQWLTDIPSRIDIEKVIAEKKKKKMSSVEHLRRLASMLLVALEKEGPDIFLYRDRITKLGKKVLKDIFEEPTFVPVFVEELEKRGMSTMREHGGDIDAIAEDDVDAATEDVIKKLSGGDGSFENILGSKIMQEYSKIYDLKKKKKELQETTARINELTVKINGVDKSYLPQLEGFAKFLKNPMEHIRGQLEKKLMERPGEPVEERVPAEGPEKPRVIPETVGARNWQTVLYTLSDKYKGAPAGGGKKGAVEERLLPSALYKKMLVINKMLADKRDRIEDTKDKLERARKVENYLEYSFSNVKNVREFINEFEGSLQADRQTLSNLEKFVESGEFPESQESLKAKTKSTISSLKDKISREDGYLKSLRDMISRKEKAIEDRDLTSYLNRIKRDISRGEVEQLYSIAIAPELSPSKEEIHKIKEKAKEKEKALSFIIDRDTYKNNMHKLITLYGKGRKGQPIKEYGGAGISYALPKDRLENMIVQLEKNKKMEGTLRSDSKDPAVIRNRFLFLDNQVKEWEANKKRLEDYIKKSEEDIKEDRKKLDDNKKYLKERGTDAEKRNLQPGISKEEVQEIEALLSKISENEEVVEKLEPIIIEQEIALSKLKNNFEIHTHEIDEYKKEIETIHPKSTKIDPLLAQIGSISKLIAMLEKKSDPIATRKLIERLKTLVQTTPIKIEELHPESHAALAEAFEKNIINDLENLDKSEFISESERRELAVLRKRVEVLRGQVEELSKKPTSPIPPVPVKEAAIEDTKEPQTEYERALDDPEKATKPAPYMKDLPKPKIWDVIEDFIDKTKKEKQMLEKRDLSKLPVSTQIMLLNRVDELKTILPGISAFKNQIVQIGKEGIPLKETAIRFEDLMLRYLDDLRKYNNQQKDAVNKRSKLQQEIDFVEEYFDKNTGEFKGMSEEEIKNIKNIFFRLLYKKMDQYWSSKVGKNIAVFGERDTEWYNNVYRTFRNLSGVKSNRKLMTLLENYKESTRSEFPKDAANRPTKIKDLEDRIENVNRYYIDLGQDPAKSETLKMWNTQLNTLKKHKNQMDRIFDFMAGSVETAMHKKVMDTMAEKIPEKMSEPQVDLDKKTEDSIKQITNILEKGLNDIVIVEKALNQMDNLLSNAEEQIGTEKSEETIPKTAYDRSHPDFDLKILYGPVMQRTIVSMLKL